MTQRGATRGRRLASRLGEGLVIEHPVYGANKGQPFRAQLELLQFPTTSVARIFRFSRGFPDGGNLSARGAGERGYLSHLG